MAEAFPGTHALVGGGTVLDIYVLRPGDYNSIIEGKEGGGKDLLVGAGEFLASTAIRAAAYPELGMLKRLGVELHTGGGAANCATGAAYLGENTTLVTVLGNGDRESGIIREQLGRVPRLTLDAVEAGDDHIPRVSINIRHEDDPNRIWLVRHQPPLDGALAEQFYDKIEAGSVDARYLALSSLQPNMLRTTLQHAPDDLPKAVNPVSAWFGNGHSSERLPELRSILLESGLFMTSLNKEEMTALYGDSATPENAMRRAIQMSQHIGVVLCTGGRDGAVLVAQNGDAAIHRQKPNIARSFPPNVLDKYFRDNGGAGDGYFIGTLESLANGNDLDAAIQAGNQNAGLVIMSNGAHGYVYKDPETEMGKLLEAV